MALLAVGILLVAASWPALHGRAETETPTGPAKTLTTGTQQGAYAASDIASDDGTADVTTSTMTATSEDQSGDAGSALAYGTESGTYANTAANDGVFHAVTAADQFGASTTTTPISPAKSLRYGYQSGTYAAASLDSDDGVIDTTLARDATNDTTPVTRSPTTHNTGAWTGQTDAYSSNDLRATAGNNAETAWSGWGLSVPAHATVTKVEALLEWYATNNNGCLDVRTTVDGSTWSTYASSPVATGTTTDRLDVLDLTSQRAWTPAGVNSANFLVGIRASKCMNNPGGAPTWTLDHVQVRVTFTYNVEAQFTFSVTEPENHWTQIVVSDSSAANAACAGEIYRHGMTTWESLGWTLSTTESTHSTTLSTSLTQYVNASNEMSVRYRCTGLATPDSLVVDLLTITVTYNPYVDTRHEYVYEMTTTKRATATTITIIDSSYRANGNIAVALYDWQATSWTSVFTVSETSEASHSSGALASAQNYIDETTGKVRVRYSSTTTSEATLPTSYVDYLRATIAYDIYAVDVHYEFTSQIAATSWTKIWVNDSAAAAPGASLYLYDFNGASWTSLGGAYSSTESAHAHVVSSTPSNHGDGSNRLRVRYAWSNLQDATSLSVDQLTVTITGNSGPTLASFSASDDMASRNAAALNDDGVDSTTVSGVIEDVNGEDDIITIEVQLYSSATASTTTYSRTVTAGDRAQTLEPAAVDNQVVVWNPTGGDDALSFKLLHVWQTTDATSPDYYEFTPAAVDSWGTTTDFSASKITKTVEAWSELLANDGVANRVYDATGTATSGSWGQWAATAGALVVESGNGASKTGRYIKIENVGTGSGSITVSWDGTAFIGETDPAWTIPIDGVLDFKYAIGTDTDPSAIALWTTSANDADGVLALTIGGGQTAWVWYIVDVPDPTLDQGYAQTFTIA